MTPSRRRVTALGLGLPLALAWAGGARAMARTPLVIATGGATGDAPAGTRGAYQQAIHDGADVIAASFAPTKDGALVALDDNELSAATDIATRPDFADRRVQSRIVEGVERSGWFVEDLTLAQIKTLTRLGPNPRRRDAGAGRAVLTFEEVAAIARAGSVVTARVVGVRAGLLHPAYFAGLDLAIEPRLADAIRLAGYDSPAAALFVMSDSAAALKTLRGLTRARRVLRLVGSGPAPTAGAVRAQAEAIAIDPAVLVDFAQPRTFPATPFIADAHAAGLAVHTWVTPRLPPPPLRPGDTRRLLGALFAAGADAVAGDQAAPIARARDDVLGRDRE